MLKFFEISAAEIIVKDSLCVVGCCVSLLSSSGCEVGGRSVPGMEI
jgi:hypothetical protein